MQIKWQNLVHGKCPKCDKKLKRDEAIFSCKGARCDFSISIKKIADILTDPNHSVARHMNIDERMIVDNAMGI